MQNPAEEVGDVVRGLVTKPTLELQAAVLRKCFTEDVEFTHLYINTTGGVEDLIAIYNMAELLVHYQDVEFQKIVYDERANAITLRMSVYVRPLGILPLGALKFLTLVEFEDHKIEIHGGSSADVVPQFMHDVLKGRQDGEEDQGAARLLRAGAHADLASYHRANIRI